MGTTLPAPSVSTTTSELAVKSTELEAEAAALKAHLAHLSSLSREDRRTAIQQNFPNPVLTTLMQQLNEAEQKLASLTNDYAPQAVPVVNATVLVKTINQQIDAQVDGVVKGLQTKMEADLETGKTFRAQSEPVPAANPEASTVTDDEDREIQGIQQLIQNSPDLINAPGRNRNTPLAQAAFNGWLKAANFLLDHGAGVNVGDPSPLNQAVVAGNRAMTELLLNRGADVNANGSQGTPLHQAANWGFQAVTEALLSAHADVNALNQGGVTPLFLAASAGREKIVQMLLAAGAKVNLKDDKGRTVLNYAIGNSPEIFQALLDAGTNPNTEDSSGRTPLSYAAERDNPKVVKLLLAAKADPNGGKLDAPLLCAIHKQDVASAELLLKQGANPNLKGGMDWRTTIGNRTYSGDNSNDRAACTPLYLAVATEQLSMVNLLLKFKADPNDSQTDEWPLLFSALSRPDILGALLDAGGKVDSHLTDGMTLLDYALDMNLSTATVETLLQHGANPNSCNSHGNTPLYYAAWGVLDRNKVALLLDHNADPNVRNDDGRTPLDIIKVRLAQFSASANQASLNEIADLLRQHGALDNLPHWDRIEVSRPSANFSASFFWKGTNDWNRFTLLEVLARQYELLQHSTRGTWNTRQTTIREFWDKNPCRFPDLQRVLIHRPSSDGRQWTILTVDVAKLLQTGDCSMDQPAQWGDVVEIPETDHPVNEQWNGLEPDQLSTLLKCMARRITISLNGTNSTLTFSPLCVTNNYVYGSGTVTVIGPFVHGLDVTSGSYALRSVLDQSKLVRASSDLSRVKVTRSDSKTGKKNEWVLNCSGDNAPFFWLRDGDLIEVPEKP